MLWLLLLAVVSVAYCYSLLQLAARPASRALTEDSDELNFGREVARAQLVVEEAVGAVELRLRGSEEIRKRMAFLTVRGLLEDRGLSVSDQAIAVAVELAWLHTRESSGPPGSFGVRRGR